MSVNLIVIVVVPTPRCRRALREKKGLLDTVHHGSLLVPPVWREDAAFAHAWRCRHHSQHTRTRHCVLGPRDCTPSHPTTYLHTTQGDPSRFLARSAYEILNGVDVWPQCGGKSEQGEPLSNERERMVKWIRLWSRHHLNHACLHDSGAWSTSQCTTVRKGE